jgi:hypothetical protein
VTTINDIKIADSPVTSGNDIKIADSPVTSGDCCASCPHWFERREVGGGECRVNPPVQFVMPVTTLKGSGVGLQTSFPLTTGDAWCGKHPERRPGLRDSGKPAFRM